MALGDILSGLVPLARGAEQGIAQRQEMERQARQQLLAQRLQEAEINHYNAEADKARHTPPERFQHLQDPVTGQVYNYDPTTGTVSPATMVPGTSTPAVTPQALAPQQPTPSKPTPKPPVRLGVKPRVMLGTDAQGNSLVVTVPAGGGTPAVTPVPGAGKPLTDKERVAGSRVGSVDQSIDVIEQLGGRNRKALDEAMAALRLSHYGKVGQAAADLRNTFNSPDAQQLYTEISNVILAVAPTYGGARPTDILLNLEQAASLPGVGGGDSAFQTAIKHMRDRARDIRSQAGRGAPAPASKAAAAPRDYKPKYTDNPY